MPSVTIRDVARRADVSVASVSRVINRSGQVSDAVRSRVNDAIAELGYVPHAGARSLSLARTNAIGVMLPAVHGEFFSEIVRGMDEEVARHGYLILLSNLSAGSRQAQDSLDAMRGRVDGLIMMAPHLDADELAASLPSGIPTILINSIAHPSAAGTIHIDNEYGVHLMIDHLVSLGRRRILHIAGPKENVDATERLNAYLAAMERHRLEPQVVRGDFLIESGYRAIAPLLDGAIAADAIFAANDNMAIGALDALRNAGFDVPGEIAVAGFDDIPLARYLGITTLRVGIAEIGQSAIAQLISILAGEGGGGRSFHLPELVIRPTTVGLR